MLGNEWTWRFEMYSSSQELLRQLDKKYVFWAMMNDDQHTTPLKDHLKRKEENGERSRQG